MCFLVLLTQERRSPPPLGCFPTTLTQTSSVLMPAVVSGPAAASDAGVLPPVSVPWRRLQTASKETLGGPVVRTWPLGGSQTCWGSAPNSTPLQQPPNLEDPRQSRPPYPSTHHCQTPPTGHAHHRPQPASLPSLPLPPPALPPPQPKLAPQHGRAPSLRPWAPLPRRPPPPCGPWEPARHLVSTGESPDPALDVPTRPLEFSPLTQELTAKPPRHNQEGVHLPPADERAQSHL